MVLCDLASLRLSVEKHGQRKGAKTQRRKENDQFYSTVTDLARLRG